MQIRLQPDIKFICNFTKAIRSTKNRTRNLLSHLNWMCIQGRINYMQVTMVLKHINGLTPQYMSHIFNFAANKENIRQCNRKVLTVPPGKHKVVEMCKLQIQLCLFVEQNKTRDQRHLQFKYI